MSHEVSVFGQLNEDAREVFNMVQKQGHLTKSSLVDLTGLKPTTLNRAIKMLEISGLLVESGTGESTGGRKPSLYTVNPLRFAVVGIDISRTYTQVVITDLGMKVGCPVR